MRRVQLAAIIMLALGMVWPWVRADPLPVRQHNLERLAELLHTERWPPALQQLLPKPIPSGPLTPADVWRFFQTEESKPLYDWWESRTEWHSWDSFKSPVKWGVRVQVVGLLLSLALAGLQLAGLQRRASADRLIGVLRAVWLAALVWLLFQLPSVDTFGHTGNWSVAAMDVLIGARVTWTPRVLLPMGLLLLLAGSTLTDSMPRDPARDERFQLLEG